MTQKIQQLAQVRLNQPSRTSGEAYAQMERAMRASQTASALDMSGVRYLSGRRENAVSSRRS
jgi:hypothetical protein